MDTQKFVDDFASLLRKTPRETLSAETRFKELPDWNSLLALSLIALVEDEYDVLLKSTDIRDAETLGGLAAVVAKQL
ncbi:phosphopantetheine-binding protein [Candidatus Spyradosoma sp. SGI.093]|uniref:phosphopantetheine-binding protein n=1 Tax=Candidatus Spyradosoma sp. SGI.093 TaxID=3420583 RepID=UPI003D04B494